MMSQPKNVWLSVTMNDEMRKVSIKRDDAVHITRSAIARILFEAILATRLLAKITLCICHASYVNNNNNEINSCGNNTANYSNTSNIYMNDDSYARVVDVRREEGFSVWDTDLLAPMAAVPKNNLLWRMRICHSNGHRCSCWTVKLEGQLLQRRILWTSTQTRQRCRRMSTNNSRKWCK